MDINLTEAQTKEVNNTISQARNTNPQDIKKTELLLAQETGKIFALNSLATVSKLSVIKWFQLRKENKDYKGLEMVNAQNELFIANTFDDLCEGMGYSKSLILEEIQNLEALGENFYNSIQTLGIKRNDMRNVRAIMQDFSDEEKEAVQEQIKSDDPEKLKDFLEYALEEKVKASKALKQEQEKNSALKNTINSMKTTLATKETELDAKKTELVNKNIELAEIFTNPEHAKEKKLAELQKQFDTDISLIAGNFNALIVSYKNLIEHEKAKDYTENNAVSQLSTLCVAIGNMLIHANVDIDFEAYINE